MSVSIPLNARRGAVVKSHLNQERKKERKNLMFPKSLKKSSIFLYYSRLNFLFKKNLKKVTEAMHKKKVKVINDLKSYAIFI